MRPIKLTLSAFGPYGGVESIDFREATDAGLFGIYGPTGSGKSSIFSAIAFALFGKGAKEEQGIGTMRSDFATDALLTEVSLQFELGSKRYYVRRIPDQPRPKTRGELDVRVHDIETGRAREIITLSGGETFIAALSLALGLSDIVEMTNGAIRLDTIFIDEGFGSLDTENDAGTLDQVLQVLQNIVGERRAVGLISHVPLVQQAVPNGFTVHKGVNGSQIEVRVG